MINIRVKTPLLEIDVSSDNSTLGEVAETVIKVGQSAPVQTSLQEPIVLKQLPARQAERPFAQSEAEPRQRKKSANGKGEAAIACDKILELKSKDFFESGKTFQEVQSALSTMGYTVKHNRLGDALLKLVRDGHLVREGEKMGYTYRAPWKAAIQEMY